MPETNVLDKGFVRLDGSMADDLSVVNSARISFATYHEVVDVGDGKLIFFLMKNHHGTPFEHNSFRFHIKAPIFVAREWFRHRIGSFNEWSGRYSKLEREFYIPSDLRTQVGKPGNYKFESWQPDFGDSPTDPIDPIVGINGVCNAAFNMYEHLLDRGVAKEQARMVLPVNTYTQFYWTINARSLMNFLALRNSDQAQFEIREYAKAIEPIFESKMPITYQAFVENERTAP